MKLRIQKSKRMNQIIRNVRDESKQAADDKTKKGFQRFFKEEVKCHGVKAAAAVKIAKKYFPQVQGLGKGKTFDLCDELFESGYCEEVWVAANWCIGSAKIFNQMILRFLKRGLKNISATGLNVILCAITL